MMRPRGFARALWCALAMLATWSPIAAEALRASGDRQGVGLVFPPPTDEMLEGEDWGWSPVEIHPWHTESSWTEEFPSSPLLADQPPARRWSLQWLPPNVIYRSYMAGVHEPRMALVPFFDGDNHTYWDATLGGRAPLLRYGDRDPLRPQGFQLDFYGAAISRLDAEHRQDLEGADYVFGFPITYGVGNWQLKFGYFHISSHLGDERAIRVPGSLDERINYVRDGIVWGASYYPLPVCRVYWEAGWAFHRSGGAKPWDTQFGIELAPSWPTGAAGAPFLAINGRLREEVKWGGDVTVHAGWMRRGEFGQTLRLGVHYFNGKSSQFQFFNQYEQHLGLGLWFDF